VALRTVLHFKGCGPWVGMKSTLGSIASSLHVNMAAMQVMTADISFYFYFDRDDVERLLVQCRKIFYSVLVYFLRFILLCDTQCCDLSGQVGPCTNAALISPTQLTSTFFTFAIGLRIARSR
jgi:hypothetical protein